MPWTVLVEAPNQILAEFWADILHQEGIPARLQAGDVASYLGPSPWPCRLMVRHEDLSRAEETLADIRASQGAGPDGADESLA